MNGILFIVRSETSVAELETSIEEGVEDAKTCVLDALEFLQSICLDNQ